MIWGTVISGCYLGSLWWCHKIQQAYISKRRHVCNHRRQRHRECRRRIPDNIWSAGDDEMSYIPKVCQNCYQIACRTDAYGATSVCGTSKTVKTPRQSKRERDSPCFARAVTSSTTNCAYTSGLMLVAPVRPTRPPNVWQPLTPPYATVSEIDH